MENDQSNSIKQFKSYKYKKEYTDMLLEHLSNGKSYYSFAGKIRVVPKTMYEWEKEIPEWAEAKEIGLANGLAWFEERLAAKLLGTKEEEGDIEASKVCTSTLIFALKTRFHKHYGENKTVAVEDKRKTIEDIVKEGKNE